MRAGDLATTAGLVTPTDQLIDVARRLVAEGLPGLAVVSDEGRPLAVLPASQVLGLLVPQYVKDDPALAGVVDEATADRLADRLEGLTVRSALDDAEKDLLATVPADATTLEVAAYMTRLRMPFLVVVDPAGRAVGTIAARDLLGRLLDPA
jgi:CBS domain-containing protein